MTEYHEGDLIRVTNPNGDTIEGRLQERSDSRGLYLGCYNWTFPEWVVENAGFTKIEVLERAPDPLPTEPGLYRDKDGDLWELREDGKWYVGDDEEESSFMKPKDYLPLTRLYAKEDVTKLIRRVAYAVDPDYEYDNRAAQFVKEVEAAL